MFVKVSILLVKLKVIWIGCFWNHISGLKGLSHCCYHKHLHSRKYGDKLVPFYSLSQHQHHYEFNFDVNQNVEDNAKLAMVTLRAHCEPLNSK